MGSGVAHGDGLYHECGVAHEMRAPLQRGPPSNGAPIYSKNFKNVQRKQSNEITRLERKVSKEKVHIGSQKIQSQKRNSASRSPVIFFENANRYCLKREKVKKKEKKDNKCSYSWTKKGRFSGD
jgi:hypothetical protein